ncbi:sarcosine oxidase [Curtobacterium sp. 9128]|uniref:N-methyl-L-tryptophan oxidase n=1 Tax=Curtobacterium sp. 9128 TaxID=1793722 RepID=UPI0007D7320F|nr:N-methyl-L-tryptophan oxidase [Curtobacterium sp. 9128]SBN64349.1 sarcosine oxidase [Curtobacterium sp. 9128]
METTTTDVVVVGLGAFGSAALWRLAARGVDVVGVDRYGLGHHMGSSHGATRLFRIACQEHPGLTPIAQKSLELWTALGEANGETYVRQTGCLSTGSPSSRPVSGVTAAAARAGLDVEHLDHDELLSAYPQYGGTADDTVGVLDPGAGICYPEKNVRAQGEAAIALGARVFTDTRVTSVELVDGGVRVTTPTVVIEAAQAVVAAGAWNGKLVPGLPLRPRRTPLYWFKPKDDSSVSFSLDAFPAFIHELPDGRHLWGHGSDEGYLVKIGMEDSGANFADTDADTVDRYIHPRDDIEQLSSWVADAFPELDPVPVKAIPCMVTNSPDGQFLVGRPNGDQRLVIAGGDHGHGFKHAAGVGELLAQITVGETPYTVIDFLDPDRFANGAPVDAGTVHAGSVAAVGA